ncbi:DUF4320 family protein [Paenibacillus polymyxa]|uniref:DUF4320 family protein n=1 Tax=Paenibacillus polymyxa TaxID=1406 RepID=UPI00111ABEFB|nr:DUF4320 family protein [Paenibacillus polymyxa]QDA30210.1 DUF4320 family protein [Paenibacillus polymyxa]
MNLINRRIKQFIVGKRGEFFFTFLFALFIGIIIALIGSSIIQHFFYKVNLKTATNEILQIVKVQNGADYHTRQQFNDLLVKLNIDPTKVTFYATPMRVQRGDPVQVTAEMQYQVFGLKLIGVDLSVPVRAQSDGLAHKYIREGG